MERLYYKFPYVKEFQATVLSCLEKREQEYLVVLDQTGFYPEGGGQPYDTGSLGDAKVTAVHDKEGIIIHTTDKPLAPGRSVKGIIDWERRFSNMQHHTGEHILSGLVHAHYGYDNVGFHMGKEEVTIDFNGILSMDQAEVLEREANQKIYDNLPILEIYPDQDRLQGMDYRSKKVLEGQVRIIEIPGCDRCACCGTHVEYTGEIGMIKVLGAIRYKGGVRITLLCGMKALLDYEKKQNEVRKISAQMSVKPLMIAEAVEKLKQDSESKAVIITQLYHELFRLKAERLPDSLEPLILFEEDLAPVQLRQLCTLLYEQNKGSVVMVCSGVEGDYQYAVGSWKEDMKVLSKALNLGLSGRGGGSKVMAQGTFLAERKNIEHRWQERVGEYDEVR